MVLSPSSVVHTVELPCFDPLTHQLTLCAHHLISSPASYTSSFSPNFSVVFTVPPDRPYQAPSSQRTSDGSTSRRKRRRVAAIAATPADWARTREKDAKKTTTDRDSEEHHASIVLGLGSAVELVRESWINVGEGSWTEEGEGTVEWIERDDETRPEIDLVALAPDADGKKIATEPLVLGAEAETREIALLYNRIVRNTSIDHHTARSALPGSAPGCPPPALSSATFVLPPSSAFLLSDFKTWSSPSSGLASLGAAEGGWDALFLDPPWPNASASRASTYDTFDAYDLWKLDIKALLGDKPCLVAVWLTNRVKYRRLLKDQLFPAWGISKPVEWYWIKIASAEGEPVWDLDSSHRRCYEGLLVGHYNPKDAELPSLPPEKVFLSVPLGHSRKPVLADLLRPFFPISDRAPNVLELFARTTLAGLIRDGRGARLSEAEVKAEERGVWMSVGNEAIKFNTLETGIDGEAKGWLRRDEQGQGCHSGYTMK